VALAERLVALRRQQLGPDPAQLAVSLSNLGALRTERGEYRAAVALEEEALSIRRQSFDRSDPAIADALDGLAEPLILLDRFDDARRWLDESERIRGAHQDQRLAFARTLYLRALWHRQSGSYALAEAPLAGALDIQQSLIPFHPDTARSLRLRGDLHFFAGDWVRAERSWREALDLVERTLGPEHPMAPPLLRWIANATKAFGGMAEAQRLLDRALPIGQRVLARCQPESAGLLNDTANLATYNGDFERARVFYAATRNVVERCYGPAHSLTATVIFNQGSLAAEAGDLPLAETLLSRAVRMWSTGLGTDHPYVARGLDALAEVVARRGRFTRAHALYGRALSIRERRLGAFHPDTAWTLANLARTAISAGSVTEALQRVDRAIGIYRNGAASQEPDHFAMALTLRGQLQTRRGDYRAARESYAEALATRERIFGAEHPLTAEATAAVASADFATGSSDSALQSALDAERVGRHHLQLTIRYLPERQALSYAAKRPRGLDLALSIAAAGQVADASPVVDSVVQSRAVILDELAARARSAVGADPNLAPLVSAVTSARERFANLMLRSLEGDSSVPRALLEETRQRKEEAERDLAERSVAARTESARARIGLVDLRRALPPGTALVSFVRYERTSFRTIQNRAVASVAPSYIAFVISSADESVGVIPLGPAAAIDASVEAWRREADGRALAAGTALAEAVSTYRTAGTRLRRQIWDPLAERVRGAKQVFVVPDGALNLVSFAALPTVGNRYLLETGPLVHLLSAERDLVPEERSSAGRGLLALGGPSYDGRLSSPSVTSVRRSGCAASGPLRFGELPGSRAEVQDIARIFASASSPGAAGEPATNDVLILSGRDASTAALTRSAAGRRVVHLSTHGFFLGADCESGPGRTRGMGGLTSTSLSKPDDTDNPLLRAGLAFAGANARTATPSDADDGILTAEEVAALNLQGTEWVVLSACDTGLGEIRAGEGVFGLRRAFQIAGVRTIIMSLWSVEDQATRSWMQALYREHFQKGANTADAVRNASLQVLQARRARGLSTHPFYWAAFVAAGDWR
jgi:CHAT domain-containing protein/tetratricopeptide (TPR) repeat protein